MTYGTEKRQYVPEVSLTPFDQLEPGELRLAAHYAHFAAVNLRTRAMLYGRNMIGVVARHESLQTSIDAATRTQENMVKGKLAAFVIRRFDGGWVGLGSIMPALTLCQPVHPAASLFPARITRRTQLGELVATSGPNISAWIDASEPEKTYQATLGAAYELLREEAGGNGWTIEPTHSTVSGEAIARSGMPIVGEPSHYDDLEVRGYSRVPLSNLHQGQTV
jgi:hypothetical protein